MWALPDIKRLNAEAAGEEKHKLLERSIALGVQLKAGVEYPRYKTYKAALEHLGRLRWEKDQHREMEWLIESPNYTVYWGDKLTCEWADHDNPSKCSGDVYHYLWYDIFSDDPKGILSLCEHHDGYYGNPSEGYFTCDNCQRTMVENYTWEKYSAMDENGNLLCLKCYAEQEIENQDNWIELTDEKIDSLTFNDIRKAKHLIGVSMPVPDGIEEYGNVEFDSMSGEKIYSTQGAGVEELKGYLRDAKNEGHTKAMLILDAAYQFAVSIGVYIPADEHEEVAA